MVKIGLSSRQEKIINIVKENQPITSENIGKILNVTRATLRPDLAILTMTGILDARPKVGYFYSGQNSASMKLDYIKNIRVKDIMSIPILVDEKDSVYEGVTKLFLEDVGTIFVISKGHLVGVASRKDFLRAIIGGIDMHKVPINFIMTRMPNIITVSQEESAIMVAMKLIEHEVDSMPVVDTIKDGDKEYLKVVGRISKTNITRLFAELKSNKED
ncbi:MAG: helix-turn-helix transcriptional regulator [Anaeromicrobium sp.]|uniref:helix-turn-helix transcriptional regulator n=1 Tax=Anaeromicrobium sp. TaxID=1929132 RepID=UPI0025CF3157|nr:helix-turn-helix transcriptional regulator [Anaeromicrobium sp.]MCT4594580.1 helix-turn-helix transcriptional regulator [Anaeromicrobium sp.]